MNQHSDKSPWSLEIDEVTSQFNVNLDSGLSSAQVLEQRQVYGPNQLDAVPGRTPFQIFFSQFADLMIGLLVAASLISALIGEWADSILIAIIVLANSIIGSVQEWRAEKAVEALRKLSQPTVRVRRDGRMWDIPAIDVVRGDLLEIRGGDIVPADARLVSNAELQTIEAALTGESLPIEKSTDALPKETALPDRLCMLFSGTSVAQGHGQAIVTATGMTTELGTIASLLQETETVQTPLQHRLSVLSKRLALIVLVVSTVIFFAGVLREDLGGLDNDFFVRNRQLFSTMLLTAVSLAVAAIPEGLPAVITVALALGSQKMSTRKAIIRRLSAVETLGSVNIICTDKTGTLTQNKMVVADLLSVTPTEKGELDLLRAGLLCNNADISKEGEVSGSATEASILQAAVERRLSPEMLRREWPRIAEIPFNSTRKKMSTLHGTPQDTQVLIVKGAAESIISLCTEFGSADASSPLDESTKKEWTQRVTDLAGKGRRVIAVATKKWEHSEFDPQDNTVETELNLLGLVGIIDPPRREAADAIARCRSAGIRPVMITGDHAGTAKAIAEDLDLWRPGDEIISGSELDAFSDHELTQRIPQVTVFARVSPEHKLKIVRAHQSHGSVVSMTGDGVNDAPALKQADIGVAMGITGTDVSKEASDMILADDNFATIVAAVEEGRVVYDNIRKFVRYLLTANAGEILVLLFAILLGMPLPLLPVHILWINLVTDGLPALALGFEPAEKNIMRRLPRERSESIFAGGLVRGIILVGLLMSVTCLLVFQLCLDGTLSEYLPYSAVAGQHTIDYARTMIFLMLSMYQLFYVLSIRSSDQTFFALGLFSNYRLTVAVIMGAVLQFAVIYLPALQKFFHTVALEPGDLVLVILASSFAFASMEISKLVRR